MMRKCTQLIQIQKFWIFDHTHPPFTSVSIKEVRVPFGRDLKWMQSMKRIFRDVIDDDLDLLKQIQFKKYKQKLKEQPILLD